MEVCCSAALLARRTAQIAMKLNTDTSVEESSACYYAGVVLPYIA